MAESGGERKGLKLLSILDRLMPKSPDSTLDVPLEKTDSQIKETNSVLVNGNNDPASEIHVDVNSSKKDGPDRIDLITPEPKPTKFDYPPNITSNALVSDTPIVIPIQDDQNQSEQLDIKHVENIEDLLPDHVRCTACNKKLTVRKMKMCKHPKLSVLLCKTCLKFIHSNEFTRDEMGIEEFCTWCGDGGDLVCCDFCEKAYCKHCVKRNLGKEFLKALLDANDDVKWKCFCCDQVQINNFIMQCNTIMNFIDMQKLKEPSFDGNKTHFSGPSQMERKKRLTEVAKQVEEAPEAHVKLKSSFPKYEISDDDDDQKVEKGSSSEHNTDTNINLTTISVLAKKGDSVNTDSSKTIITPHRSDKVNAQRVRRNSSTKKEIDVNDSEVVSDIRTSITDKILLNSDIVRPVVVKMDPAVVSKMITKIQDSNQQSESGRSRTRGKKITTYNEKKLQRKVEEQAEKKLEEERKKKSNKVRKKKQTVIMVSSENESDDDEFVVVSKSGKRQVITKSHYFALQAVLSQKGNKKDQKVKEKKSDKKGGKGLGSFMRLSFLQGRKNETASSSSDSSTEDGSEDDQNDQTDNLDSEIDRKKNMKDTENSECAKTKRGTNTVDKSDEHSKSQSNSNTTASLRGKELQLGEKSYNIVVDDQQPGPSGIRPKNKMQKRRQAYEKRRPSTSDSDSDDVSLKTYMRKRQQRKQQFNSKLEGLSPMINEETQANVEITTTTNTISSDNKNDKNIEKEDGDEFLMNDQIETQCDIEINEHEKLNSEQNFSNAIVKNKSSDSNSKEVAVNDITSDKEIKSALNNSKIISESEQKHSDNAIEIEGKYSDKEQKSNCKKSDKKDQSGKNPDEEIKSDQKNSNNIVENDSGHSNEGINSDTAHNLSDGSNEETIEENETVAKASDDEGTKETNNEVDMLISDITKNNKQKLVVVIEKKSDSSHDANDADRAENNPKKEKTSCDSESSCNNSRENTNSEASSVESDKNDSDTQIKSVRTQKRRKCNSNSTSSNTDNESESQMNNAKRSSNSRVKKRRKRARLNSGSTSEDSSGDEVEMSKIISSDSSSNEGSVIITRKSKRQKNQEKKKVTKNVKSKNRKKTVVLSDSDSDDLQSPSRKGRRKIRRILKDHELNEETIHARELEEQRRKRLLERTKAERQDIHHIMHEEEGDFVLERNEKKEVLVSVDSEINKHLKPHQRKGIKFVYDCCIETVKSYKKGETGGGCLLAHCMGLGKTLQVVSILHTFMNNENIKMSKFLVVAPLNTVLNWEQEFEKWLNIDQRMDLYVLSYCTDNKDRVQTLRRWYKSGGVVITGYEMYRNLVNGTFIKSKKFKEEIRKYLVDPGPEIVVCDEGHVLRNDSSAISKAMNSISTKRRIVLTGTPLQNNLPEYHVMVDFVKPNLLGTRKEFLNRFVNPIHNGQCSNSTPRDVKVMKQRSHVLYQLLSGCVQRQDYSVLSPFLPPKREYTIFVRLTDKQIKIYQHYIENFVYKDPLSKLRGSSLFSDFQCLSRIWTHPWSLQIERQRRAYRNRFKEEDSMDEFIDDNDGEESKSSSSDDDKPKPWTADTSSDEECETKRRKRRRVAVSRSSSASDNENESDSNKKPAGASRRGTRNSSRLVQKDEQKKEEENKFSDISKGNGITVVQSVDIKPAPSRGSLRSGVNFKDASLNPEREDEKPEYEKEWYDEFIAEEDEGNVELSGKLVLMMEVLANAEVVGDKVLVFSQSLTSLDLIESCIGGGKIGGNQLNWCHGVDYFRMDGSTAIHKRKRWADIFNDPDNEKCRLFLISTKAGSLGINMVAANRVIIFDCSWNPSHDVQSVFRVYRFGQEKPVYVYRFISQGTMEEKVYGRQITKLAVAGRVVDEMQIERHFTDEEIRELYTFAPDQIKEGGETPQLPKDPLLAEVLQRQHPKYIVRYHEHDLLLENVESEELTEDERKQAWKSYEDEKDQAARVYAKEADFAQLYSNQMRDINNRMQFVVNGNQLFRVNTTGNIGVQAGGINVPTVSRELLSDAQVRLLNQRGNQALIMAEHRARANQIARLATMNLVNSGNTSNNSSMPPTRFSLQPGYTLVHGGPVSIMRPPTSQVQYPQNFPLQVRMPSMNNSTARNTDPNLSAAADKSVFRISIPSSGTNQFLMGLDSQGQKRGRPSKYDVPQNY